MAEVSSFLSSAEAAEGAYGQPFSVAEISRHVKTTLESQFVKICVKGELSSTKLHSSGHLYFTLKDTEAVLDAICWRGTVSHLGLKPADGMEVICYGRLTTYSGRSKYQMIVENMTLSGEGSLLKILLERKARLLAEGLFDPSRKKKLPPFPQRIGVITSPTGAVIQDIIHRVRARYPLCLVLWPVSVQGPTSSAEITRAVTGFNGTALPKVDLIILARGGGSFEDLWGFNDEALVRAIANSSIPLISAVGHETDTSLVDYAADVRAPTPTAAAELATPLRQKLKEDLDQRENRLARALLQGHKYWASLLQGLSRGILNPRYALENKELILDDLGERLEACRESLQNAPKARLQSLRLPRAALLHKIHFLADGLSISGQRLSHSASSKRSNLHHQYEALAGLLEGLSYAKTLERGFCLVTQAHGTLIKRASALVEPKPIVLHFYDGERKATVQKDGD